VIARSADVTAARTGSPVGQAAIRAATPAPIASAASLPATHSAADLSALTGSSSAPTLRSVGAGSAAPSRQTAILPVPTTDSGAVGASQQTLPARGSGTTASTGNATAAAVRLTAAAHHRPRNASHPHGWGALSPWLRASSPSVIDHFVGVVPGFIWLLLGLALGSAGAAGTIALRTSRRARRQASELAVAAAAAHTDSLTGALNRRGFTEAVERELARARRYERRFVLAYLDVRGLKALNDSAGHPAGDALLQEVAALLKDSAREADVVGRIGGDEFALLLPEQPADTIEAVTGRIRERVVARRRELGLGVSWDLTIGTAAFPHDGESFDELVATADRRLYEQRGIELGVAQRVA
jgi:diguanylate cyclase (GGDEF)-like protein